MRTKKIKDLSNQELVTEYSFIVAKESSWIPGPNARGIKEFEKTMQRSQLLRIELLSRLGEPEESIFSYAWEQETWASDAKRSSLLQEHLSSWETDKKRALTLSDAIQEAISLLSTFNEVGHANYDLKNGEGAGSPQEAEEQKETARKEMRLIRAFIRKHKRTRLTKR
ncbi:hypothetical protein ASL14_26415 (plasmid) [Paenibacillus sp. IHB B 3084]|uniref:hypothetical protein n=1 Tax=Paenibacillus sp. IHB B 3084 TaxID=867076 RepID=UPI00072192F0|nr:hypothetical protein [Paenibacillus sp. IHB B 3084]ALP39411.1 hypothetical protein ASL14_26415 [Paenibacillus sp. IHB B 3084]